MTKKRKKADHEEGGFQELMQALRQRSYEELMDDSGSESGFLFFSADREIETVYIRTSDEECGSIPYVEFREVTNYVGKRCLVCGGLLGLIFDPESRPVLYLICDKCEGGPQSRIR